MVDVVIRYCPIFIFALLAGTLSKVSKGNEEGILSIVKGLGLYVLVVILGLMIIPPNDKNTNKYFKSLDLLNNTLGLKELSMGMSADYLDAVRHGSNFVKVGSSIFGSRS